MVKCAIADLYPGDLYKRWGDGDVVRLVISVCHDPHFTDEVTIQFICMGEYRSVTNVTCTHVMVQRYDEGR
jgi:hypothetical protein